MLSCSWVILKKDFLVIATFRLWFGGGIQTTLLWQHGEKELKNYSREEIVFLDVEAIKKGNQFVADLCIKPTDFHQYLHASSSQVFHSKKSIPYSQALRLNRICSENSFFDKRYNDLEIWLKGRVYSDKLVGKQILKARTFSRAKLLNNQRKKENEDKLVLNITYRPSLGQLKVIMTRIHLLLTSDNDHNKVFRDVAIIGFCRAKSLKDILVMRSLSITQI